MGEELEICFLCEDRNCSVCEDCGLVAACPSHLPFHRDLAGTSCYPWRVARLDGVGRVLVAVRDTAPLEVVLEDRPVGVAPLQDSPPVCLVCFRLLSKEEEWHYCVCGFPMCSAACLAPSAAQHQKECLVYTTAGQTMKERVDYQLIMPIRLMLAMKEDAILCSRLHILMDHYEERHSEATNWALTQQQVIRPIQQRFNRPDWSETFIQRCLGLIRTNATRTLATCSRDQVAYDDREMATIRVLYPSMSPMSHSCIPNTRIIHRSNLNLEARAVREVRRGEEFTISYTGMLTGGPARREDFIKNWFFRCTCPRCLDATDLGTHFDSWCCEACGGWVVPPAGLAEAAGASWSCAGCGALTAHVVMQDKEKRLEADLNSAPTEDEPKARVEFYERFLADHATLLHTNHHLMVKAKARLAIAYTNPTTHQAVRRKIELCQAVLAVIKVIMPGQVDLRGMMLYEQVAPLSLILQQDFEAGTISKEKFVDGLRGVESMLSECISCLGVEERTTYCGSLAHTATRVLHNIRELIEFSAYL